MKQVSHLHMEKQTVNLFCLITKCIFLLFSNQKQHSIELLLFIHQKASIGVLFEFSEASVCWCFKKITAPFQIYAEVLLELFRKAVQRGYSLENILAPASLNRSSTTDVISVTFQHFKNVQGQAGSCKLKTCNQLYRKVCNQLLKNSITELFLYIFQIFKTPLQNLVTNSFLVALKPVD